MGKEQKQLQRAPRKEIDTKVEFIIDSYIDDARSQNISSLGMSFTTQKPIKFRMRLNVDGKMQEHTASLVWAKKDSAGATSYGFEFITDDDKSQF
jgi:hypothetical protein